MPPNRNADAKLEKLIDHIAILNFAILIKLIIVFD